jgi:hypothetical protein
MMIGVFMQCSLGRSQIAPGMKGRGNRGNFVQAVSGFLDSAGRFHTSNRRR